MGKTRSQHYRKKQHTKRRVGRKRHKSHRKHRKRNRHNKRGGSDPQAAPAPAWPNARNQRLTKADTAIVEEAVRKADAAATALRWRAMQRRESEETIPRNQTYRKIRTRQPRILRRNAAAAKTQPKANYIEDIDKLKNRVSDALNKDETRPKANYIEDIDELKDSVSDALNNDEPLTDDDWKNIKNLDFKQPRLLRELVGLKLEKYYSEHPDETNNIPLKIDQLLSNYRGNPIALISMLYSLKKIQTR